MLNISQKRKLKKKIYGCKNAKIKLPTIYKQMIVSTTTTLSLFITKHYYIARVIIFQYQNSTIIKMGTPSPFC
jgi:hypothetical protein